MKKSPISRFLLAVLLFVGGTAADAGVRGNVTAEGRYFPNTGLYSGQEDFYPSLSAEVEVHHPFGDSGWSLTLTPFYRHDGIDEERTHGDLREARLHLARGAWEWDIGLIKVFWGVTESRHLVDIINQTDFVENLDGEDKLGQLAIHTLWYRDWGTIELFALPGFRERTFPGPDGRLRGPLPVDTEAARYQSGDEARHLDWALRVAGTLADVWDIGLSYFSGTSREPDLIVDTAGGAPRLLPYYPLIDQLGLDVQATLENWLLKLEAIHRQRPGDDVDAAVAGFEYTFYGIGGGDPDLGVLMEYHRDSRGESGPTPLQNDLFIGARWAMNDVQSTDLLAGAFFDLDSGSQAFRTEFNRRLGQRWKLTAEVQIFGHIDRRDVQYPLRRDDYLQIELARYF